MGLRQQRAFSDPGKHLSGPALPPSMYVAVAGNSEIGLSDLVTGNSVPRRFNNAPPIHITTENARFQQRMVMGDHSIPRHSMPRSTRRSTEPPIYVNVAGNAGFSRVEQPPDHPIPRSNTPTTRRSREASLYPAISAYRTMLRRAPTRRSGDASLSADSAYNTIGSRRPSRRTLTSVPEKRSLQESGRSYSNLIMHRNFNGSNKHIVRSTEWDDDYTRITTGTSYPQQMHDVSIVCNSDEYNRPKSQQGYNNQHTLSTADCSIAAQNNPSLIKPSTKNKCSRKCICMLIIPVLMVIAGTAACLYLLVFDGKGIGGDISASSINATAFDYLLGPPDDIQGRCNPGNLPASLQACKDACSCECCYPSLHALNRQSCLHQDDELHIDACQKYRPYCDVVHDPWPGATEGILREPRAICAASVTGNDANVPLDDKEIPANKTLGTPSIDNLERERQPVLNDTSDTHRRSMISAYSPSEVCPESCVAARCCYVVADDMIGLILSSSGVYINTTTGDFALSNCRWGDNEKLCNEYDKYCNHLSHAALTSSPSLQSTLSSSPSLPPINYTTPTDWNPFLFDWVNTTEPLASENESLAPIATPSVVTLPSGLSITMSMSMSMMSSNLTQLHNVTGFTSPSSNSLASKSPSIAPSPKMIIPPASNSTPSKSKVHQLIIPPAHSFEIADACSGEENIQLTSSNFVSAYDKCINACTNGLCCFVNQLGFDKMMLLSEMGDDLVMQSCYEGNEEQCNGYLPCLVLSKAFADTESNNTFSNTNASSSETQSTTVPSIPSASFELATPTLDSLIEVQEEPELPVAASTNMTATIESQNEFQATINTTAYNENVQSIINSTAYAPIPTTLDYFNNSEEADLSVTSTQELGKLPVVAETAMESQQNEFQSNVNATSYATFPMLDYNPYNNVDDNLST